MNILNIDQVVNSIHNGNKFKIQDGIITVENMYYHGGLNKLHVCANISTVIKAMTEHTKLLQNIVDEHRSNLPDDDL